MADDELIAIALAVKPWRKRVEELEAERDAAVSALRVLNEETVLAGFPGGDRDQTLANVRAMKAERDALRELLANAICGCPQTDFGVQHHYSCFKLAALKEKP